MNYNKVNVISNELSNTKEFKPLGDLLIAENLTVNDLVRTVNKLLTDLQALNTELATYKGSVREAFMNLQHKFDMLSISIENNRTATDADLNNIKEAIKLLGGVL